MTDLVLIPGGSGGLGRVVTARLIEAGYRCVVPYRSDEEARTLRGMFAPQQRDMLMLLEADMCDEDAVARVFDAAAAHGPLYALVHCLGGVRGFAPIADTSTADWDALVDLNLRSLFLSARAAMRVFAQTRRGRIVSIGAMASVRPAATQSGYGVAKAGVAALTAILADEGRAIGVTANCIAPGIIRTEANLAWGSPEEIQDWVTPAQISGTVLYLLRDEAAAVNGTVIRAFGGLNP